MIHCETPNHEEEEATCEVSIYAKNEQGKFTLVFSAMSCEKCVEGAVDLLKKHSSPDHLILLLPFPMNRRNAAPTSIV